MGDSDDRSGEAGALVTLVIDYEGSEDFLSDYSANLSKGSSFVYTDQKVQPGQEVRLILSFPGLVSSVQLKGCVRAREGRGDEQGVSIELLDSPGQRKLASVAEAVGRNDSGILARVVNLLVVEDNPHVARLIRDGLGSSRIQDLSFSFRSAANGSEALELLTSESFDALIIDVYLPILDGPTVIAETRKREETRKLPIIAVSAGGPSARADALAAGADLFIDKPMRLRQILEGIRSLILGES